MFPQLFPEVPEDLAALTDEQLQSLYDEFRSVSRQLRAGEINLEERFASVYSADRPYNADEASAEAMTQWTAAAQVVGEIRELQASRVAAVAEFDAQAAELDAQFADAEGETPAEPAEGETPAEGEEQEGEEPAEPAAELADETVEPAAEPAEEPAPVVAAAPPVRFPATPRRHAVSEPDGDNPVQLVAAGGNTTARVRPGEVLTRERYAEAVYDIHKSKGPVIPVKGGGRERVLIASAQGRFPSERVLISGDHEGNLEKLRAANIAYAGRDDEEMLSLLAAGVCPPPTPIYTLPDLESTERPVRDFLTTFNADRGGVTLPAVDTIGDVDADAISVITNDDAIEGGTFATKSCADIACGTWTPTYVDTIAHCRGVDNLMSRTWPEGIAKQNSLTLAALARTADGKLLDGIDALSIQVTGTAVYGAVSTLLYRLQLSRVQMISSLRLPRNTRVDVLLPFWAAEMFSLDLVNSNGLNPGRLETPQDAVGALLSRFGFNVYWHLDEGIAVGADDEIFQAQTNGAQVDWPGTIVVARVALPGEFIRLDTGTLELGQVRDSDLNAVNKYQLFGELWENVARVGPAEGAHRIEITVCPNGSVAPAGSLFTCSAS